VPQHYTNVFLPVWGVLILAGLCVASSTNSPLPHVPDIHGRRRELPRVPGPHSAPCRRPPKQGMGFPAYQLILESTDEETTPAPQPAATHALWVMLARVDGSRTQTPQVAGHSSRRQPETKPSAPAPASRVRCPHEEVVRLRR